MRYVFEVFCQDGSIEKIPYQYQLDGEAVADIPYILETVNKPVLQIEINASNGFHYNWFNPDMEGARREADLQRESFYIASSPHFRTVPVPANWSTRSSANFPTVNDLPTVSPVTPERRAPSGSPTITNRPSRRRSSSGTLRVSPSEAQSGYAINQGIADLHVYPEAQSGYAAMQAIAVEQRDRILREREQEIARQWVAQEMERVRRRAEDDALLGHLMSPPAAATTPAPTVTEEVNPVPAPDYEYVVLDGEDAFILNEHDAD